MTPRSVDVNDRLQQVNNGFASDLLPVVPLKATALASFAGPEQTNRFWLGLVLAVNTVNLVGSGTWKPSIQTLMADQSTWFTIWQATTAISTATNTIYAFYAQSTLSDFTSTEHKNIAIPKVWRVYMTYGGNGTSDTLDVRADAYMLP
jgi:hypothetical protein